MIPSKVQNYVYLSLSFLWLYSGLVPILLNQADSLAMLAKMGILPNFQWALFILASVIDLAYGVLILTKFRHYPCLWLAQFVTVASYSVLIGLFLPENWLHPFAPLIKNVPIMAILFWLYQIKKGEK